MTTEIHCHHEPTDSLSRARDACAGDPMTSTVVHGSCMNCGEVIDPTAHEDFMYGPRFGVQLTVAMVVDTLGSTHVWQAVDAMEKRGDGYEVYARRAALDRLAADFRNIGRTNHDHAALARHAAHRIEAALKGARV